MRIFGYIIGIILMLVGVISFIAMIKSNAPNLHLTIPIIFFLCGLAIILFQDKENDNNGYFNF